MRFVVYDTISIQKQILGLPLNLRNDFILKRLLAPFKEAVETEIDMFKPDGPITEYAVSITQLEKAKALLVCKEALEQSYRCFWEANYLLNLNEVRFGLLLGDPKSKNLLYNQGFTGYQPTLGAILLIIWPDEYTLPRLPLAVAHEFNHQMRLSYEPWGQSITLDKYIVFQGLADSFVKYRYGEELMGPWLTQISAKSLENSRKIIGHELGISGLSQIGSYMYGDEIARINGSMPVGLQHGAGYAVGYHLVQAYLKETGKSIMEATMTSTEEIIDKSGFF